MPEPSTRDQLVRRGLDHLLAGGSADASLRGLATGIGTSHSLLLYHFGSRDDLLAEIHRACEERMRDTLGRLMITDPDPSSVVRAMWREMADPTMFPLYRLSTELRMRAAGNTATPVGNPNHPDDAEPTGPAVDDVGWWIDALRPVISALGIPAEEVDDEAALWISVTRGLLVELAAGLKPTIADRAAERFFRLLEARRDINDR